MSGWDLFKVVALHYLSMAFTDQHLRAELDFIDHEILSLTCISRNTVFTLEETIYTQNFLQYKLFYVHICWQETIISFK